MTVDALVARARAAHARLMTDTVTISRVTSSGFNATTGDYTTSSATIYTGRCRLRGETAAGASVTESLAADAEQTSHRYRLLIPHSSATVLPGDVAVIGSRTFTVVGDVDATTTTAQALIVEEVES